jgi:hypothetical protein
MPHGTQQACCKPAVQGVQEEKEEQEKEEEEERVNHTAADRPSRNSGRQLDPTGTVACMPSGSHQDSRMAMGAWEMVVWEMVVWETVAWELVVGELAVKVRAHCTC